MSDIRWISRLWLWAKSNVDVTMALVFRAPEDACAPVRKPLKETEQNKIRGSMRNSARRELTSSHDRQGICVINGDIGITVAWFRRVIRVWAEGCSIRLQFSGFANFVGSSG